MEYKLLLDTAVIAGELLIENGAETYRVEDTMLRMLKCSGLMTAEVFVTVTGFMVTLDDPSIDSLTVLRRVKNRGIDLNVLSEVNAASRAFCHGDSSLEETFDRLLKLRKAPSHALRLPLLILAYVGIAAGFTMVWSISPAEILLSALCGLVTALWQYACRRMHMRSFLCTLLSSALISICAVLGVRLLGIPDSLDHVIIGAIMSLVPGVAITNAAFDTINGDYLSGTARLLEACVTAAAIVLGVGVGLRL